MSENQVVKKAIGYLESEQRLLEWQLRIAEERHEKVELSLSRLPSVFFLRQVFLKKLLPWKQKRLEREIADLKQRINQLHLAIADLERGKYELAIPLLDKRADRFVYPTTPLIPPNVEETIDPSPKRLDREFFLLVALKGKLISLQNGKE